MQFAFWLLFSITSQTVLSMRPMPNDIQKIYKARMNKKTFETVKNLHLNWYTHALKALFGQIGKQLYRQLNEEQQKILASCLDQIADERDLAAGAKCLIEARNTARYRNFGHKSQEKNLHIQQISDSFVTTNDSGEEIESSISKPDEVTSSVLNSSHPFVQINGTEKESNLSDRKWYQFKKQKHHHLQKLLSKKQKLIKLRKRKRKWQSEIMNRINGLSLNQFQNLSNFHKKIRKLRSKVQFPGKTISFVKNSTVFRKNLSESEMNESDRMFFVNSTKLKHFKKLRPLKLMRSNTNRRERRRKRSPYRLISNHVMKSDNLIVDVKQYDKMPSLHDPVVKKTPVQQMAKLMNVMIRGKEAKGNWTKTYERIIEFKKQMDSRSKSRGAKVYDLRLFDLVLGNEEPSKKKIKSSHNDLMSMAFDFVNKLSRNGKKNELNFRFLSPRFMPVMPDKIQTKERLLSPSIMSFYRDDSPDSIASLPKLLEGSGMTEKDRQAVIEMIMDVSGARVAVDMSLDILKDMNIFGLEDEFFEATERISDVFKNLEKSFNKQQSKDMDSKGYTFLEVPQIKKVLHQHGVKKPEDVDFDVEMYGRLTRRQREEALWQNIERIARNKSQERNRTKRFSVLSPVVLAPYMFSPIIGVSILGPVVLSPNIFSPLVFNPSVLGPFVMSPAVFMPFLISPYILSPYVMTPIFAAPFVLNPYILSPNVINPYVLSPLVLSPYILCPDIISPQALGGQYLSPSVFSPSILTESVLMGSVLSPSWMS